MRSQLRRLQRWETPWTTPSCWRCRPGRCSGTAAWTSCLKTLSRATLKFGLVEVRDAVRSTLSAPDWCSLRLHLHMYLCACIDRSAYQCARWTDASAVLWHVRETLGQDT